MPAQPLGEAPGTPEDRLRRVAATRQERIHAPVEMLCEGTRGVLGDRRHDVARAVARELGAQRDGARGQVAAQARGPADDLVALEVRPRPEILEERAAEVLLDLLARLLDGDLGERGDRREVQELGRLGRARRAEQQHGADELVARRDRHLGRDRLRDAGGPVGHSVGDVAAQFLAAAVAPGRTGGRHGRADARHDDRDRRAGGVGGEHRHALQPVAAQDGVEHLQVDRPEPGHEARRSGRSAGGSGGAVRGGGLVAHRYAPQVTAAAGSGWACSTSSPASPVRTR